MAYKLYLDGVQFPVTPEKITLKINGNNEVVTLINEGEANILKAAGLSDVDFDLLLPNVKYPFAFYEKKFLPAEYYLEKLEALKLGRKPFHYKITRSFPVNKKLFDTDMMVSLEDYTITEEAKEGFDVKVKVKLKQYQEFTTKTCQIDISLPKPQAALQNTRPDSSNAPSGGSYTVVKGDCLWNIAKKYYGTGSKWQVIYQANRSVIGGNPNLIYPGQVLTIPAA